MLASHMMDSEVLLLFTRNMDFALLSCGDNIFFTDEKTKYSKKKDYIVNPPIMSSLSETDTCHGL
jgi:hypothetical protein